MENSTKPTAAGEFTDEEVYTQYVAYLDLLVSQVRPLLMMPLVELARANERMQTLGSFFDPTAYMRGGGQNLTDQRRAIDAAVLLQSVLRVFAPAVQS
jgi:hypothetical protein